MYPPFEYEMINQRRDELWRLADQARRAKKASLRKHRKTEHRTGPVASIGNTLIRAGRALGGDKQLHAHAHEC